MPDEQFYAIGCHGEKGYKGILSPKYGTPIEALQTHLLNIGIVVSLVTKEKYDNFDPNDIQRFDLAGETEEGELNL